MYTYALSAGRPSRERSSPESASDRGGRAGGLLILISETPREKELQSERRLTQKERPDGERDFTGILGNFNPQRLERARGSILHLPEATGRSGATS